jgi:hypothetical protein
MLEKQRYWRHELGNCRNEWSGGEQLNFDYTT